MASKIEWTDETWNPIVGCSKVSAGCDHCYAERDAVRNRARLAVSAKSEKAKATLDAYKDALTGDLWSGGAIVIPHKLTQPLTWRRPRRVFVCSMSDLFHATVPHHIVDTMCAVMALCPQHTFQVLTKRPKRMAGHLIHGLAQYRILEQTIEIAGDDHPFVNEPLPNSWWPLKNVWLGTSVENQAASDERIPHLLNTPAAVRWLSMEPLLGPVDLDPGGLDWVVIGGESGPNARVTELDWIRSIRDQCQDAGVPVFIKQITENGRKVPYEQWPADLQVREWPKGVDG